MGHEEIRRVEWPMTGYESSSDAESEDRVNFLYPWDEFDEQEGSSSAAPRLQTDRATAATFSSDDTQTRVTVASPPESYDPGEDQVLHLVEDEDEVADLHACEVPPDEYYEELMVK